MKKLAGAWLASSAAFAVAFVGFMALWLWLDERTFRPPLSYLRLGGFAFGPALAVQLVYGGLVYFILTRIGRWNIWTVTLAYLLPVAVLAWLTVDTVREGVGTIAWLAFACIVAAVFWFFAPASVKADRTSSSKAILKRSGLMAGCSELATGLNNIQDERAFIKRLTETIAWCRDAGSPSEPRTSLRMCKPVQDDLTSQSTRVFSVCLERSRRLSSSGKRDLSPVADLCGGRLLAYFPDDNLACGAAEVESQGFFDVNNIPPYDTWVWMVRNVRTFAYADGARGEMEASYLVAWIPPDFIQLANAGIAAIPEACVLWLDTLDDEFVRSLRRMGFFS